MQRWCECVRSPQLHLFQYEWRFVVLNPSVALLIRIFLPYWLLCRLYCELGMINIIDSSRFFIGVLYFSAQTQIARLFSLTKEIKMTFGGIFVRI